MKVEEISINVFSDDASALSSLTGESATEDCLDDMKSYGLHSEPDNDFIFRWTIFAFSLPITLDNLELTNLHGYIARCSSAKHICCLRQAEIGTGTSKLIIKMIKKIQQFVNFYRGN